MNTLISSNARRLTILCAALIMTLSCIARKPANQAESAAKALRIGSMAPAATSIIVDLGLAGQLVAIDTWSASFPGIPEGTIQFDMMEPDVEKIAEIAPDILFVSEMTKAGTSKDPFKPLSDSGIRVVYLKTSETLADIKQDTLNIAALCGKEGAGKEAVSHMEREIERIRSITVTIPETERKTAVFEVSPAPYIYSFGAGVYLDEILTLAGLKNILSGETGWLSVSAETIVAANPDVILTNVSFLPNPIEEIGARPGWNTLKAVKNGSVYLVDANASSQPAPAVVKALREIAEAVYPEYHKK